MQASDIVRLRHMLDAALQARSFAEGRNRRALEQDAMLVLALVKAVEIVGEAACQVTEETRARLPQIPWEDMVGMRHRLVHAYFDINLDVLWEPVRQDLPTLIRELESVLRELPRGDRE